MLSSLHVTLQSVLHTFHNLSTVEMIPSIDTAPPPPPPPPPPGYDIEAEPVFGNIVDARKSLAQKTWDQMTAFYKRTPIYDTDIAFSCSKHYVGGGQYVWWVPLEHPIAEVLKSHDETSHDGFAPEDVFKTDLGNAAVFSELAVETCIRAIASMCRDNHMPLVELITAENVALLEQQEDDEEYGSDDDDSSDDDDGNRLEVIVDQSN